MRNRQTIALSIVAVLTAGTALSQVAPPSGAQLPVSASVTNLMTEQQKKLLELEKRVQMLEQQLLQQASQLSLLKSAHDGHTHTVPVFKLNYYNQEKDKTQFVPYIVGHTEVKKTSSPPVQ